LLSSVPNHTMLVCPDQAPEALAQCCCACLLIAAAPKVHYHSHAILWHASG
jgi:hypothetical protein